METKDVTAVIGSALSAASILFAVYTFRRNDDRATFTRFRLALIDFRHLVKKLDDQLTEPVFNEISIEISKELEEIFTSDITSEDLIEYLLDEDKLNYVKQAIHQGIRRAPAQAELNSIIESLERLPIEFSELFPVVSSIIDKLNFYATRTARGIMSPKAFDEVLCNPESINKLLAPELKKIEKTHLAYREISLLLGAVPHALLKNDLQETINEIRALAKILVAKFSTLTDSELRTQSRIQNKISPSLAKIDEATSIEDAFEYFKLIKELFLSDWDRIVEAKTKIVSNTTKAKE